MNTRLLLGVIAGAMVSITTGGEAVEMHLQFYQCPPATAQGASCGARGIEDATVCVEVVDDTVHPDVDFATIVALEELRTRTSTGIPHVRVPGKAKLNVFPLTGGAFAYFEGTLRFIMIPPRDVDACPTACEVQYEWNYMAGALPRPTADIHVCSIDVPKRDDYRCTRSHQEPSTFTSGGAPAAIYRFDEAGETVMVEDGHQTRRFGMALKCPESRLREQVRPTRHERMRPGDLHDQMRPTLPEPGDIDPHGTPRRAPERTQPRTR